MNKSNLIGYYIMSTLAGGINFSFNLFLLKRLSPLEFKNFSLWFTYVSMALFLATMSQYLFFYRPLNRDKIKTIAGKIIITLVALHLIFLILPLPWSLAILTVAIFMAIGLFNAFFQRHLSLWKIGLLALIGAISKYAGAFCFGSQNEAMDFISVVYASALISFLAALLCFFGQKENETHHESLHTLKEATYGALVLAFLANLLPQLDFLIISFFKSQEELVVFSKVIILEKIVFFAFIIYNQMLLALDNHWFFKKYHIGKKSEGLILAAFVALWFLGESILAYPMHFLEINLQYGTMALSALLHALLLCLIFLKMQELISHKKVQLVFLFCALFVLEYIFAAAIQRSGGAYLTWSLKADGLFISLMYAIDFYKHFKISKKLA